MTEYQIWIDGKCVSRMENVNLHQINLDSYHAEGKEPIEKRVKHDRV